MFLVRRPCLSSERLVVGFGVRVRWSGSVVGFGDRPWSGTVAAMKITGRAVDEQVKTLLTALDQAAKAVAGVSGEAWAAALAAAEGTAPLQDAITALQELAATGDDVTASLSSGSVEERRLSPMDQPDYWSFVESEPPPGMYGYTVINADVRNPVVLVDASDRIEADMRAVQVAKFRGQSETIAVDNDYGPTIEVDSGRWQVELESW